MQQDNDVPAGYMRNASGHLVPASKVREQDLLRDQAVKDLVARARELNAALAAFKQESLRDIADLVAIAGERYDLWLGGKKGNVTLLSFDGSLKVARHHSDVITFSEELESAKAIIDNCIRRWSEGSSENIQAIVSQAFRTNNKGEIKTGKVIELMQLDIDDPEWKLAMSALRDALHVSGTSTYLRFHERIGDTDKWRAIPLDLAKV